MSRSQALLLPDHGAVGDLNLLRGDEGACPVIPLNVYQLSPFSLEFIDDCALGGSSNGSLEIENLLGRPTADSAQADVNHFLAPIRRQRIGLSVKDNFLPKVETLTTDG